MSSRKFWGILVSLAGALLFHQGYHWLEKEWSTAILSEGDDEVRVDQGEESREPSCPDDQEQGEGAHPNQFGISGPSFT